MEQLLAHPHRQFPFAVFQLLETPEEASNMMMMVTIPECRKDTWTLATQKQYPDLRGDDYLATLTLPAHQSTISLSLRRSMLHQTPAHCEICADLGLEDGHSLCRVALSAHPAWEALEVVWTVGMPTSTATPSLPATEGSPCQTAPEAGPSKLESFYLNSGFGHHISSLVTKAQELAISDEVLQKK